MNRHHRRAAEKLTRKLVTTETTPAIDLAMAKLTRKLEECGNTLSPEHRNALLWIVGNIVLQASGQNPGRHTFRLDTGMGKSSAILAVLSAVHELGLPWSFLICASKVEQICTLFRGLTNAPDDADESGYGVPRHKVGLWFRAQQYDPEIAEEIRNGEPHEGYTSEQPTTTHQRKQFLFVCHNRVRSKVDDPARKLRELTLYTDEHDNTRERPCVLWDESLIVSDNLFANLGDLAERLDGIKARVEYTATSDVSPDLKAALDWFNECRSRLRAEFQRQMQKKRPQVVKLPERDEDTFDRYMAALPAKHRESETFQTLRDMVGMNLRVVRPRQGPAVVTYRMAIPPEIRNICVLDASWPIRTAMQLDASLQEGPAVGEANAVTKPVKFYDAVSIRTVKHRSGKQSVQSNYGQKRLEDRTLSMEVCNIVRNAYQKGEAVLIFLPKANGVDSPRIQREDLEAAGIDTRALWCPPAGEPVKKGRPRKLVNIATWGQETADNAWSHCQHVVLVSTQRRSDADMVSLRLGQRGDLLADVSTPDVALIEDGEVLHTIYQALSRGACREVVNGQAKRMVGYIFHPQPDHVVEGLKVVMPVRKVELQPVEHVAPALPALLLEYVRTVREYLAQQPENTDSVSFRAVKPACKLALVSRSNWEKVVHHVTLAGEWLVSERSFVRGVSVLPPVK